MSAFQDAMRDALSGSKASSSDSGRETSLQDGGIAAVEGVEARIRKLEGMMEMMVNKAGIGSPVEMMAESKNETNISNTPRGGEGRGPMRTGLPGDQRKANAIAILKRMK